MEKGKMEKDGKNEPHHFGFLFHNILGHSQGIYKICSLWLS